MALIRTLENDFNPIDLCNSTINFSRAKMQYSFPKGDRFNRKAFNTTCKAAFYDLPHERFRSNRYAGFGIGGKFDFTKGRGKTPGPCEYEVPRTMTHKRTFSFGLGRSKVSLNGIVPSKINRGDAPGPGTYPIGSTKSRLQYSFAQRLKPALTTNLFAPAPDTYQIPETLNEKGLYNNSKYVNSKACRISNSAQSRFKSFDTTINFPAPDRYKAIDTINNKGGYTQSKFRNSLVRSFSQADRNTLGINIKKKNPFPGPGNYRLPSEFGYYISSEAKKSESMSTPK